MATLPTRRSVRTGLASLVVAALLVGIAGQRVHADTWQLIKGYSEVRFSWDNLGLSRQSARFTDIEAKLDFSPTEPERANVEVRIRAASLQSGMREFDELLRRPEFFNVATHPTIVFKSGRVEPISDRTGIVAGDLTLNGVTKPVALAVTWNFTGAHPLATVNPSYQGQWVSGFSARATLQRSAFAMGRGLPLVSDDVDIAIEVEFVRKGE